MTVTKSLRAEILEKLNLQHGMSHAGSNADKAINDFVHSKNKRFAGKSKKERIHMALGAAYGAAHETAQPTIRVGEKAIYERKMVKIESINESGMAVVRFADRRDPIIVRGRDLQPIQEAEQLNEAFMMSAVPSTYVEPSNYGFIKVDLRPEDIGLFEDDDTGEQDDQEEDHDNGSNVRHDGHTGETEVDNLPKPSDTIAPAYTDEKPPKEQGTPLITEPGAQEEHLWDEPHWDGYDYPADAPDIPTAEFQGEDGGNARAPNYDNDDHQPSDGQDDRPDDGNEEDDEEVSESDHWIQGTHVNAPGHKGNLHRKLGIPQGQKIGPARINRARHSSDPAERREANMAHNMNENEVTDPARNQGEERKELSQMRKDLEFVGERQHFDDEQVEAPRNSHGPKRNTKQPDNIRQARRAKEQQKRDLPWMDEGRTWSGDPDKEQRNPKGGKDNLRNARKDKEKKRTQWMDESKFFLEMSDLLGSSDADREPTDGDTITVSLPAMAAILVTCCHRQPEENTLKAMVEALAEVSKGKTIEMDDLDAVAAHMNGEECDEMRNREEGNPDHQGIEGSEGDHEGGHHEDHERWPGDGDRAANGSEKLLDGGDPTEPMEALYYGGDDVMRDTRMTEDEEIELLRNRAFPNRVFRRLT